MAKAVPTLNFSVKDEPALVSVTDLVPVEVKSTDPEKEPIVNTAAAALVALTEPEIADKLPSEVENDAPVSEIAEIVPVPEPPSVNELVGAMLDVLSNAELRVIVAPTVEKLTVCV